MSDILSKKIAISNIYIDYLKLYLLIGFAASPFIATFLDEILFLLYLIIFFGVFGILFIFKKVRSLTFFTFFPVIISISQNILLGINSPYLTENKISYLLSFGMLYAFSYFVLLLIKYKNRLHLIRKIIFLLFSLVIYGMFIALLTTFNFGGFLSSFRNLSCPLLYLAIGLMTYRKIEFKKLNFYITLFFWVVLVFGIYEVFFNNNIWINFNIGDLWEKKGIPLYGSQLPVNFYSSEIIFGNQLRRMSSLFADPVNLGTFFGFCNVYFFYKKKYCNFIFSIIGIALTVSKGGLLTLLILFAFSFYSKRNRSKFILSLAAAFFCGVMFVIYSYLNSTQSIVAHLNGFFGSFSYMINRPLGAGIGNVGVLSAVVTGFTDDTTAIFESGFGMIIGQLGFFGLVLYVYYGILVVKNCVSIKNEKILKMSLTLFLAIAANIMFNEVALSPNSSAIYFMFIGFLLGYKYYERIIL